VPIFIIISTLFHLSVVFMPILPTTPFRRTVGAVLSVVVLAVIGIMVAAGP
jgi:hypothetical protein